MINFFGDYKFGEIVKEKTKQYKKYGLKKNPFPLSGNFPEGYLKYTYLNDADKETIGNFLFSTFERKEFNGLLILGGYGSGKSHLLNIIHETVTHDEQGIFESKAKSFLIQNPNVDPINILLAMLEEINLNTMQDLIFFPIKEYLKQRYRGNVLNFLQELAPSMLQMEIENKKHNWFKGVFAKSYQEFYQTLHEHHIRLDPKKMQQVASLALKQTIINNDIIVKSLVSLLFKDETNSVRSWIGFLNDLISKSGKLVNTNYYLEAILKLFQSTGINHIYLLIDEMEDLQTSRLGPKSIVDYLVTLRRMIQHNYKLFSFVLASTKVAWDDLKELYPAIDDRFPLTIRIGREPNEIKQIIKNYLYVERDEAFSKNSCWYPFSEEAIDKLIKLRGLILRDVLSECRYLIDYAISKDISPPFTAEFVEENISFTRELIENDLVGLF